MRLCDALGVPRGVTAVVGGGGKTSLIDRLCRELSGEGAVLRLTTTHMRPPECRLLLSPTPGELRAALGRYGVVAVGGLGEAKAGSPAAACKLGPPSGPLEPLFSLADYVLIEADGSRGLPLKAPADHEPVLTGGEGLVVAVAGVTGTEKPIALAAHRPARYAALVGKAEEETAAPEDIAAVLQSPLGQRKNVSCAFAVVLNQCDSPRRLAAGRECAQALRCPCVLTALQARPEFIELGGKRPC